MPSSLGNFGRRWLDSNTGSMRAQLRAQEAQPVPVGPPFGGYTPDLAPSLAGLADAKDCTGLITRGEGMVQDDGFSRVDSARLPLGASSLPSATAQAVVGLYAGYDQTDKSFIRLAVTCRGSDTLARLYELQNSNGQWAHRAAQDAARDMDGVTDASHLFDFAYFPPAQTGGTTRGAVIFTNNVDQIMRYPSSAAATTYDIFDQSDTYFAKSVEVSEDRVLALNTNDGTRYLTRLIWTNKGAAASFSTAGTGAGFADFLDVKGQGLKVMNLGQLVALYFDSAVVVLQRTGLATDPFRRLYTSHDRGVMSTHSVVQLGSGVHFGIFTDGWFFFDDQARWEEVGVRVAGGVNLHKWHKTFYELLDWENRARVVCTYDHVNRYVRIAFPTRGNTAPDMVWNYDLLTDTVWPDVSYGSLAPNCWGTWFDITTTGTTWDGMGGSQDWDAPPLNAWDSYAGTRGRSRVLHGTTAGLVFKHDPSLITRDGSLGNYRYTSHLVPIGGAHLQKTAKRLAVGYERIANQSGGDPPPITASLRADSGQTATRSFAATKGTVGTNQSEIVAGQVSGTNLGWEVSGSHPVTLTAIEMLVTTRGRMNASGE